MSDIKTKTNCLYLFFPSYVRGNAPALEFLSGEIFTHLPNSGIGRITIVQRVLIFEFQIC